MSDVLPGTMLRGVLRDGQEAFDALSPVFAVSGGSLSLSQITELTGLGASAVQNWVKRGWVSNPVGKRYGAFQVARILLINMLRPAMRLEDIAVLLSYINGDVDDRSDDIIPEPRLYSLLCTGIGRLQNCDALTHREVGALAGELLADYADPVPGAGARLSAALTVMLLSVLAAGLMEQAEELFNREIKRE